VIWVLQVVNRKKGESLPDDGFEPQQSALMSFPRGTLVNGAIPFPVSRRYQGDGGRGVQIMISQSGKQEAERG